MPHRLFSHLPAIALLASALAITAPAVAQEAPTASPTTSTTSAPATPTPPAPATEPISYAYVTLTTSVGKIVLALDKTHAPLTTANFLKYVDSKRMDGALFYRAMHFDTAPKEGLLQGGIRDASKLLPPVAHEPTSKTGILNTQGTVSMARFAPGTATSDFLILMSDMPSLDAAPGNEGKEPGAGFAAFGHVISGMDVARTIWNGPRSATKGDGVMKGQMLENEVKIISARRTSAPPTALVTP